MSSDYGEILNGSLGMDYLDLDLAAGLEILVGGMLGRGKVFGGWIKLKIGF